jgi:GAF domain
MPGSTPAGTVDTSPTLPDRPTRAAEGQAESDPAVAIATRPQAEAGGRATAHGKRTILPDLRASMKSFCGTFCDLDLAVVLERVVAAARQVSSARYATLGVLDRSRREPGRSVTDGVDEVTRRRIHALPRERGVLAELIANPAPVRAVELGAHRDSYGFPGDIPLMTVVGAAVMAGGQPLGDLYLTDGAGGEEFSERDEEAVQLLAGVAIDRARTYTGLKCCHPELRRAMDALDATMWIARAGGGEIDLEVILGPVAKRARAVVSARTPGTGREHGWAGTSG